MTDTIQVVRMDDDIETQVGGGRMQFWHEDEQRWFDLGVVIELTEDRPNLYWEAANRGVVIPSKRRWVSEWEGPS